MAIVALDFDNTTAIVHMYNKIHARCEVPFDVYVNEILPLTGIDATSLPQKTGIAKDYFGNDVFDVLQVLMNGDINGQSMCFGWIARMAAAEGAAYIDSTAEDVSLRNWVFGSDARIEALRHALQAIQMKGLQVVILSAGESNAINTALEAAGLDTLLPPDQVHGNAGIKGTKLRKLMESHSVLYSVIVDDDPRNLQKVQREIGDKCVGIQVAGEPPHGLSIEQLQNLPVEIQAAVAAMSSP